MHTANRPQRQKRTSRARAESTTQKFRDKNGTQAVNEPQTAKRAAGETQYVDPKWVVKGTTTGGWIGVLNHQNLPYF